MCGIVGYIGVSQAAPILLDGLSKLEYRGYDSAGLAVYDGDKIQMQKATGRLKVLSELTHDTVATVMELPCQGWLGLVILAGQPMAHRPISMRILILTEKKRLRSYTMELLRII